MPDNLFSKSAIPGAAPLRGPVTSTAHGASAPGAPSPATYAPDKQANSPDPAALLDSRTSLTIAITIRPWPAAILLSTYLS